MKNYTIRLTDENGKSVDVTIQQIFDAMKPKEVKPKPKKRKR